LLHHWIISYRSFILYVVVLIAMRLMGKRQMVQLQPYEFVIAIMIAELAVLPIENIHSPITHSIYPIVILAGLEIIISTLSLKNEKIRTLISGRPTIVIENGHIRENTLRKLRYNLDELMGQLRNCGYHDVTDVEFAVLETSGQLSVFARSQSRPVTPKDLKVATPYEGLTVPLVLDGVIKFENLELCGLNYSWLAESIKKAGLKDIKDVFYAGLNTQGQLHIQSKEPLE